MKLNVKKFSIGTSIIWGLCILLIGWLAAAGWGNHILVDIASAVSIGFQPSFFGSLIGGLWGAFDGLIGGYIIVTLYNRLLAAEKTH
ncbi:MAG: bacteriophage holin [Candidatus Saccharimonadales bacterium]